LVITEPGIELRNDVTSKTEHKRRAAKAETLPNGLKEEGKQLEDSRFKVEDELINRIWIIRWIKTRGDPSDVPERENMLSPVINNTPVSGSRRGEPKASMLIRSRQ
jgi:hypothetical protein